MQLKLDDKTVSPARALVSRLLGRDSAAVEQGAPFAPVRLGLSAKLLILTALFVMVAEVLIFVPSIANFRINWLVDRLTAARLASLAADAVPDGNVPAPLRMELLSTAKVQSVAIKHNEMRRMVLPPDGPMEIDASYDLRLDPSAGMHRRLAARLQLIVDALAVFVAPEGRTIRVYGHPFTSQTASFGMGDFVEVVLSEAPLRQAMITHALNILWLSIIISVVAAAMVYAAVNRLLVQPIMRITRSMLSFSRDPQNASSIITPSSRTDEAGVAERELAHMQEQLRQLLNQKSHLAALGLAVSKINHDLRNILASAQLLSDRLGTIRDPAVQSFSPKLIATLDRAISFCNDTLQYGRAEEAAPKRNVFRLADLVEEVGDGLGLPRADLAWTIDMEPGLMIDADRGQLFRVLNNLARNSLQAIEQAPPSARHEIRISARRENRRVHCELADTGPGVPEKARNTLFQAFQGGTRKGGTGLGLAIAAELVAAHGGKLELSDSQAGAEFRFDIPDRKLAG